ncbi:unnamed protein product [Effrenium voratum]|nr:unnamed protein product [Effrenium voratum]CAJ1432394.1 unnamed protein product [Effrenium voratum]
MAKGAPWVPEARAKRRRGRPFKFQQGAWAAAPRLGAFQGVLLVITEQQAMQALLHVGEPDPQRRPAALLAVPCPLSRAHLLRPAVQQALPPGFSGDVRVELMRSTVEMLGCDLWRLDHHMCLAALNMPYSAKEIEDANTEQEKCFRRDLCNQMDLFVTAYGRGAPSKALAAQCRLQVAPSLWREETQLAMRRTLGVGLPLQCKDAFGATVQVILLSEEVQIVKTGDLLCFTNITEPKAPPAEWFCFTSRQSGKLYYWNQATNISTAEPPWGAALPDGWAFEVCSTSGRIRFRHPQHGVSTRMP